MRTAACHQVDRRQTVRGQRLRHKLFGAAICALMFLGQIPVASQTCAQSLMVGADGAVHLDELSDVPAGSPIIIQEDPELIGPSLGAQAELGGMATAPMQSVLSGSPQAYSANSIPFVPYMPVAAPPVQQPLPILYSFFGEFLFLHPTGADVIHARQQDGPGSGASLFGDYGEADLHYEPGVRIGGDMALSPSTSLAAMYTYFESNARNRVTPPTIDGGGGTVESLVLPPSLGALGATGPVDARSVLDFQLGDIEYRARLLQGPRYWINGGVGARYAHLEQKFGQVGAFPGDFPGTLVTQSDIDFDGGGVRLALDGGRTLGNRGFSVYGRTSLSPVAGQFIANYSVFNETTDQQLVRVEMKEDRVVTILDYEFGIAWSGPRRRWRFSAGYTTAYWFNALTTEEFIQGGDSDTIIFDGLVTRVEHLW